MEILPPPPHIITALQELNKRSLLDFGFYCLMLSISTSIFPWWLALDDCNAAIAREEVELANRHEFAIVLGSHMAHANAL